MCGICGIIKFNNHQVNENDLRKMMQTMKYRGPDDEGVWINSSFGLGFVRLSIIDLSPAGNQPMLSKDGRYVIVFNGEIYNYIELTQELISKGYVFITRSDTEVLLSAYSEWGEDCLNHLNGMFAFAIYDKKNKSIFAARDRFGVKPFYYYKDDEQFIFASEIPPILSVLKQNPRPNNQAIFDYLVFNRTDQTEDTFFEGIKKLQHGCQLSIVNHQLSIRKWYNLHANLKDHFYSPEEYRALFTSSINMRLRSDVPVGVCLSGGLDSSSIVSTMLQQNDITDFNTYSAIYGKGKPGDESKYIQEYADKIKLMHYAKPEASSLLNDMDKYIMAHAEPIPSTSSYAQFKVMELAKQNVKVILSGQGADEELAGYHYFFGYYFKELLYKGNIFKLIDESFHYLSNHHSLFGFKTFLYFILSDKVKKNFHASKNIALNPDFILQYQDNSPVIAEIYNSDSLNNALLDHFEYKLEHLLKWDDRNSMFFSLEARAPFLDYRLVEKTLSLPPDQLIYKGTTKHLLRESMKGILPEKIRMRQSKIGFSTPEDEWFRENQFRAFILDIFQSQSFKTRGYIDPEKAIRLYQKHCNHKINISKDIWKWLHLELWFRMFID